MTSKTPNRRRNLSITSIVGLTGCVSLLVIGVALVAGLWLDRQLGQRGPFTICLLILSVPVSLYLMIRIALTLVKQIEPSVSVNRSYHSSEQKEE